MFLDAIPKLKLPPRRSFPRLGFVVLALAALFNIGALLIANRSYQELQLSSGAVVQTQRVLRAIDRLHLALLDAETGQDGYLVTGDVEFLAPYRRAQPRIAEDLATLRGLVDGNPVQKAQFETVHRLVTDRLTEIDLTINARRAEGFAAARAIVMRHTGRITLDTIRASLDGMAEEESRVRDERIGDLAANQRAIRLGFLAEASLNLILVTLGALSLWSELRRRRLEQDALHERGATLEAQVRERTAQLTELSRFQEAVREDEKKRVARELHDALGGTLTAAKIDLKLVSDRLKGDPVAGPRLARINAALDEAIAVKRRVIEDLRPTLLDNLGLCAALRWQCEEFTKRTGCDCLANCRDSEEPAPDQSIALYRIVQEALTNIAKYARANTARVDFERVDERWRLRISDDGIGIDPEMQHHPTSHGLISIRERVRALGGHVTVTGRPAEGTVIEILMPVTRGQPSEATVADADDTGGGRA